MSKLQTIKSFGDSGIICIATGLIDPRNDVHRIRKFAPVLQDCWLWLYTSRLGIWADLPQFCRGDFVASFSLCERTSTSEQ